jgi:flagellar protein FlbD
MIAVTCRNGEHFSVDPDDIERVETVPDTVVHLVDGAKYVLAGSLDALMLTIREYRAVTVVHQQRLAGGVAELADRPAQLRIERRARNRDAPGAPPTSASDRRTPSPTDSDTD